MVSVGPHMRRISTIVPMPVEHRITVAAPAAVIFRIDADVAHWHTWAPDTKVATVQGPFQLGTHGKLTPTKGNTVPMLTRQRHRGLPVTLARLKALALRTGAASFKAPPM